MIASVLSFSLGLLRLFPLLLLSTLTACSSPSLPLRQTYDHLSLGHTTADTLILPSGIGVNRHDSLLTAVVTTHYPGIEDSDDNAAHETLILQFDSAGSLIAKAYHVNSVHTDLPAMRVQALCQSEWTFSPPPGPADEQAICNLCSTLSPPPDDEPTHFPTAAPTTRPTNPHDPAPFLAAMARDPNFQRDPSHYSQNSHTSYPYATDRQANSYSCLTPTGPATLVLTRRMNISIPSLAAVGYAQFLRTGQLPY